MAKHAVTLRTRFVCLFALAALALSGCASSDTNAAPARTHSKATATVAKGMTRLAYPSKEFPAQSGVKLALTLQVPKSWKPVQRTGTTMGARAAEGATFTPNLLVSVSAQPDSYEFSRMLTEIKKIAATKTRGVVSKPYKVEIDGLQFDACELSWTEDKVGTVTQTLLFSAVPSGSSVQLITVTGSVGGAQAKRDHPTIMTIIKSLTVT